MAFNRRLFFWLIREYIKRWGKFILLFFLSGIIVFFIVKSFLFSSFSKFSNITNEKIGLVGSYTVDSLPPSILNAISSGLTQIDQNGNPLPALASRWDIKNNGKTYIIYLKDNIYFSDGSKFTSNDINYSFSDVKKLTPNKNTIVFELKDAYAPFLNLLSKPIFKTGFVGVGDYKVANIQLNSGFITSVELENIKNSVDKITYYFYPTNDALKIAFMIGEINEASGLNNLEYKNINLEKFPNINYVKNPNYSSLVTAFYNNNDSYLSDKRLRDALAYALPDQFPNSIRALSPFFPTSWAYIPDTLHVQDLEHSKLLLQEVRSDNKKALPAFTLDYLPAYKSTALILQKNWNTVGIKTNLQEVESTPINFQIFLTALNIPSDPDQYTLWHSDQINNITGFKDLRIDKLLEDGRRTVDQSQRIKIYTDFQKYLLDDQPASFLYFPYNYTIIRK